jgi:hypothetical protein
MMGSRFLTLIIVFASQKVICWIPGRNKSLSVYHTIVLGYLL